MQKVRKMPEFGGFLRGFLFAVPIDVVALRVSVNAHSSLKLRLHTLIYLCVLKSQAFFASLIHFLNTRICINENTFHLLDASHECLLNSKQEFLMKFKFVQSMIPRCYAQLRVWRTQVRRTQVHSILWTLLVLGV